MWSYEDPIPEAEAIRGYRAFYWDRVDGWYEEDEEIFIHPRSPYTRVDVLRSSRRVRAIVGGETVADTRRARLLFETGKPVRYYIPEADVRMDLLAPTGHATGCPYKGRARYWTIRAGGAALENAVWSYPDPLPESAAIAGLLCFYDERVDEFIVEAGEGGLPPGGAGASPGAASR